MISVARSKVEVGKLQLVDQFVFVVLLLLCFSGL